MYDSEKFPRAALAEVIEEEIAKRDDHERVALGLDGGGIDALCHEIAAAGHWNSHEAVARRVYSIRYGEKLRTGELTTTVNFETVDRILNALGLEDLWHSDERFAAFYAQGVDLDPPESFCRQCEEWTLGTRCGVCDKRTVTAEKMLERKHAGRCELTGRVVKGITGGHRLVRSCEHLARKLGRPIEERLGLKEPPAKGPLVFRRGHISKAQVELLYRVYEEERLGIPTLARMVWDQLGFANEVSCSNAINRARGPLPQREGPSARRLRRQGDSPPRRPRPDRGRGRRAVGALRRGRVVALDRQGALRALRLPQLRGVPGRRRARLEGDRAQAAQPSRGDAPRPRAF